jgi:hypothetical protein
MLFTERKVMRELFDGRCGWCFYWQVMSCYFLLTVIQYPKRFLITGKMTAGCLRLILIKGFSPAQNRLQCGDVIENVSKADYDRAISGDKQTTLAEAMKEIFIR